MSGLHPAAARGFSQGAGTYARGRPDFPAAALDWLRRDLGLRAGTQAAEVGAGTGKFTKLLAETGTTLVAVEPVAAMLERLARDLPGVKAVHGHADRMPLPDASVDAVVCAQAFHWFATAQALAEFHRVLKPGGALGLIWNVRDATIDWVRALARILERFEGDAPRYDQGEWRRVFPAPGFGPLLERSFPHQHAGPAGQVIVERVASVSFIAAMDEASRGRVLDEVRALIAVTPALAGHATVAMPYVTRAYWCRRD